MTLRIKGKEQVFAYSFSWNDVREAPTESYFQFQLMSSTYGLSQVALVVNNPPASAGDIRDAGLIPGLGRYPGESHGNPLQYSAWRIPMDRGAWQGTVHGIAESDTTEQLSPDIIRAS